MSEIEAAEITTAVIHDGDTEEVYVCANEEMAWRKVANTMTGWLGSLMTNYTLDDSDLGELKARIESGDYAAAASLWEDITNGDQYFSVAGADMVANESPPIWPAEIGI